MQPARLARRLRDHDWMAAVIELVIVIAGILIALQVSNWNQERSDRARGDVYLAASMPTWNPTWPTSPRRASSGARSRTTGRRPSRTRESGQLVQGSQWKTLLAYYQASQIRPFELEDTSFAEMRDAGDLGLIR